MIAKSCNRTRAVRIADTEAGRLLSYQDAKADIIRLMPRLEARERAMEALHKWTLRSDSITQGQLWDIITHARTGGVLLEQLGETIH